MRDRKGGKEWIRHFLPLLRPFRKQLFLAVSAMVLDAAISVFRPWPLKVVIDGVLSHKPSRVPLLRAWLDTAPLSRTELLYGACAATLLIAIITGSLTYYITWAMGDLAQHFVFAMRRDLFAHLQRLSLRFHDHQRTGDLTTRLTSDTQAIQEMIAIGITIVMWYGATRVLAGELTTGDVVLFFAYITSLYNPMKGLARSSYLFSKASVGAERISEVMSVRSEVTDREGALAVSRLKGDIEFRNVAFGYETGQIVLSHINLTIAAGEKVAIVGATGAGKSTLASLIPRFYDPSEGQVCIDGQDIRNYSLQSLREQISLVLQESLLFSGTIRDNIAFARPGASDKEIAAVAATANANEFIQWLPEGYETLVAERGTTLSGGQKQRIAIARAILRDAPILILDEPTSGLDAVSERTVMEALERAVVGRTTLIIAHRLTTVRLADRIVVLERGRIVEEGTHTELVAHNGRYARLYRLQMTAETEPV